MNERLTKRVKGEVGKVMPYSPSQGKSEDVCLFSYHATINRLGEMEDALEPIPADEYHEDYGSVIWWRLPVNEPPYIGSTLCDDFIPNYYTHFTRIILPLGEN